MSILIPGMEMPENCEKCEFKRQCSPTNVPDFECMINQYPILYCSKSKTSKQHNVEEEYLQECPLVPIPEKHGRLIDAEDFVDYMQNRYDNNEITNGDWIDFRLSLKDQPTIVPAEGGGEDGTA